MTDPISDDDLRFAVSGALRGLKLPSTGRALSQDDRHAVELAVFRRLKLNGWAVVCEPSQGFSDLAKKPDEKA